MRRYLIIAALAIVFIGLGLGVYFYFFAPGASITATPGIGTSLPSAGNSTSTGSTSPGGTSVTATPDTPSRVNSRLVRIDAGPVVPGEVVVDKPAPNASSSPDVVAQYVERQSGNIYVYSMTANALTRTSNKTIPGIEEATWLPSGATAFVRYLSGADFSLINTYALPMNGTGGFFLPQNLAQVSAASTSILVLASGANGTLGTLEHTDGSSGKQAFSSPLTMLRATFAGAKSYLAYTKPSSTLDGYAYLVDAAGNFSRVAGPLQGLTALASPLGNWVLVSYTSGGALKMELVDAKAHTVIPLPVATIAADKCAWTSDERSVYCGIPNNPSINNSYPDDWYQGAVSFTDKVWKIDVNARLATQVLDFSAQTTGYLDATALAIDPQSKLLVFLNKIDGSLWSFQL